MLVELSVMEQRYQAVLAVVQDGWKVTEVAERLGVSRQSVHAWIARYEAGGLTALVDRSHRPASCPHQIRSETEAHPMDPRREPASRPNRTSRRQVSPDRSERRRLRLLQSDDSSSGSPRSAPVPRMAEYGEIEAGERRPNWETFNRICEPHGWPHPFVDGRKSTSAVATTSEGRWTGS